MEISDLIFSKGESGYEKNPLLKHRTTIDWVAAIVAILLAMMLISSFRMNLISSNAAGNGLLAVMVIYLTGELASRRNVLIKIFGIIIFGFGVFVYLLVMHGIISALAVIDDTMKLSFNFLALSAPAVLYFLTQKGTYHYHAALVGCGVFSLASWIAILIVRGNWGAIDFSGHLLFLSCAGIIIVAYTFPKLIESVFLQIGWPICTITYIAIRESGGNFENVLKALIHFVSMGVTFIVIAILMAVLWKRASQYSFSCDAVLNLNASVEILRN